MKAKRGGMNMNGYQLKTKKGYEFYEVASAFQKSIRRNEEEQALYFAVELYESGYDEYVWKRMKIITSEDVGLAEPMMPATIQALYQSYLEQKKKKDEKNRPERLFLVHAVLLLCRARKSRLVDWTLIHLWNQHDSTHLPIPEYAYDKHNAKGRAMGRGVDHFFTEGTLLVNASEQPREPERKLKARESSFKPASEPLSLFPSA
jgi:replication-associated recombination protein RarA